jgi:hypothetical protein
MFLSLLRNKIIKTKDMKKLYTLLFGLAIGTASYGQAFTATYDFAGTTNASGATDPSTVPTATNITFGSFTAVNPTVTGAYNSSAGGRFSFANMPLGATNADDVYGNLTGSIDLNTYYQVVMTPATNMQIDLSQIAFRVQRSGTGIRTYAVRTSADNFASNLGTITIDAANAALAAQADNIFFWTTDATTSGQNGSKINVTTINDIAGPLTVRFYGWNAEGTGGTFSIDDVIFTGTVEATAGLKDNNIAGLKLFPNPLSGNVLNVTSNSSADKTIAVYDVLGKNVLNAKVTNETVNVSALNSGVYIVKITEEGKTATRKLVVK